MLLWDAEAGVSKSMRIKEESEEYRYFEEPDLPSLRVATQHVSDVAEALPELPFAREQRFRDTLGLPPYDAEVLTASRDVADYFETVAAVCGDSKAASNWVMTEVLAWRNERPGSTGFPMPPARLAALIALVASGRISNRVARLVFAEAAALDCEPEDIVSERDWNQVRDETELLRLIEPVLAHSVEQVARYRAGEDRLLDFFVGKVMRASGGRADPQRVTELLRERLEA